MQLSTPFSSLLALFALTGSASAHGVLTAVTGANGITGQGFGVLDSTPRDGTKRNPFQQDTSIIRNAEIRLNQAGVCGRTLASGNNDVATQLATAAAAGLPSASEDGTVTMTLHQVNGDGAGPYTCSVSADGTGSDFVDMTVTTNVPGKNSRSNAKATDFALVAQMPTGTTCTGGPNGDACLVRCRNAAAAGPFGGCAAVTNGGSNTTTTTSTTDASSTTTSTTDSATSTTDSATSTTTVTSTDSTDSTDATSTSSTDSASETTSGGVQDITDTDATFARRVLRRSLKRSPAPADTDSTDYEIPDDQKDAEVPLDEADRALAEDLEKRLANPEDTDYEIPADQEDAEVPLDEADRALAEDLEKRLANPEDTDYEIPADQKDAEIPLDEADRLLAEDLEKFRSREKRLAERLERVKRMRIVGAQHLN